MRTNDISQQYQALGGTSRLSGVDPSLSSRPLQPRGQRLPENPMFAQARQTPQSQNYGSAPQRPGAFGNTSPVAPQSSYGRAPATMPVGSQLQYSASNPGYHPVPGHPPAIPRQWTPGSITGTGNMPANGYGNYSNQNPGSIPMPTQGGSRPSGNMSVLSDERAKKLETQIQEMKTHEAATKSSDQGGLFGSGGLLSDKRAKKLEDENIDLQAQLDRLGASPLDDQVGQTAAATQRSVDSARTGRAPKAGEERSRTAMETVGDGLSGYAGRPPPKRVIEPPEQDAPDELDRAAADAEHRIATAYSGAPPTSAQVGQTAQANSRAVSSLPVRANPYDPYLAANPYDPGALSEEDRRQIEAQLGY